MDRDPGDTGTILNATLYHNNDFCIKLGSDEGHFNSSFIVRNNVTIKQCPQNHFPRERRAEAGNRTDVQNLLILCPCHSK